MSLIPFILDLADELHEFNRCLTNAMEIDDYEFGIYPSTELLQQHRQQQQQQQPQQQQQQQQSSSPSAQRRQNRLSHLHWLPQKQRHHPYLGGGSGSANKDCSKDGEKPSQGGQSAPAVVAKAAPNAGQKYGFQVSMNVKQFAPEELTVKTVGNCIVVEGRHEDKEDGHGVISRHFIRKYMLPKDYDPNDVLSTLSSDGILTVKAPLPAKKTGEPLERIVAIEQTGPTPPLAAKPLGESSPADAPSNQCDLQNQPSSQSEQNEKKLAVVEVLERNGDANSNSDSHSNSQSNETTTESMKTEGAGEAEAGAAPTPDTEKETEKQKPNQSGLAVEEALLADAEVTPAAIDAIITSISSDGDAKDDGATATAAAREDSAAKEDGVGVGAVATAEESVATESPVATAAATAAPTAPSPTPMAGDLVEMAANDAAILLAKAQQQQRGENGSQGAAVAAPPAAAGTEEVAN